MTDFLTAADIAAKLRRQARSLERLAEQVEAGARDDDPANDVDELTEAAIERMLADRGIVLDEEAS